MYDVSHDRSSFKDRLAYLGNALRDIKLPDIQTGKGIITQSLHSGRNSNNGI